MPQEFESHSPKASAVACQGRANIFNTSMTRADAIAEDTRFRLLRLIEENPHLSQREISTLLGVSLGGVNYCLRALAANGLVKIENFRKSGSKLGYLYLLTPEGIAEKTLLTEAFLRRKMAEYEALRKEIESLRSGVLRDATNQLDPKLLGSYTSGT